MATLERAFTGRNEQEIISSIKEDILPEIESNFLIGSILNRLN